MAREVSRETISREFMSMESRKKINMDPVPSRRDGAAVAPRPILPRLRVGAAVGRKRLDVAL